MKVQIISLFPAVFKDYFDTGMLRKAQELGLFDYKLIDLRDFGLGPRRQVDDTPAGGGDGMVLMVEPMVSAIESAKETSPHAKVIAMTPRGDNYVQSDAQGIVDEGRDLIIICGRYEGYDERIMDWVDEEVSIGNYVLTGGELPAMLLVDSVVRLVPGVLGGDQSAEDESFADDETREHPQYTKPAEFRGKKVPEVLLSGDHAKIAKWRRDSQI